LKALLVRIKWEGGIEAAGTSGSGKVVGTMGQKQMSMSRRIRNTVGSRRVGTGTEHRKRSRDGNRSRSRRSWSWSWNRSRSRSRNRNRRRSWSRSGRSRKK